MLTMAVSNSVHASSVARSTSVEKMPPPRPSRESIVGDPHHLVVVGDVDDASVCAV
jgi:hypothetical protein